MKKEWLKHYILAFAFLGLIVISILMLFSQIRLAGFAVYAGDAACGASVIDNSEFSANQLCNDEFVQGLNGPTITTNNVALDCKSIYSLTGDTANGFGIKTTATNSIIKNCRIKSFKYDLNISGENTTIIDTNLSASATSDANISGIGRSSNVSNYSNDMNSNTTVLLNLSIASDALSPSISIVYPANNTNHSTANVNVNYSVSDAQSHGSRGLHK